MSISLALVTLGPTARGAFQDAPAAPVALELTAVVQRIVAMSQQAAEPLAALSVAHRSRAETVTRLQDRLAAMGQTAGERELAPLQQRAEVLTAELQVLAAESVALNSVAIALGRDLGRRADEAQAALLTVPKPRLADLLDAEIEAAETLGKCAGLAASSDLLLQQLSRLNAQVQDVHRSLEAAVAPGRLPEQGALPAAPVDLSHVPVVELLTSEGPLLLELRPDLAPRHVQNFLALAEQGFYDGLSFHRIVPGFLAQSGCPKGDGSGGPGHTVSAEFNPLHHRRGALSMARFAHPDSAGSQFFICLADWSAELDGKYTVFGRLLRGQATLDAIALQGTESGVPSRSVVVQRVIVRARGPGDVEDQG